MAITLELFDINKSLLKRRLIRGKYCCRYSKIPLKLKVAKHWQNEETKARRLKHKKAD